MKAQVMTFFKILRNSLNVRERSQRAISLSRASSCFSQVSLICLATCLFYVIFGRSRLFAIPSKSNALLSTASPASSKHAHTITFCLIWLVCPKFLPNQAIPKVLHYAFPQLILFHTLLLSLHCQVFSKSQSRSLAHHASLPHNIADLTQLR